MRYAIISDVHANEAALRAVLTDAADERVEKIICLGDVLGYGPEPVAALELVYRRVHVCLAGNHDDAVAGRFPVEDFTDFAAEAVRRHRAALTNEALDWLSHLPYTCEFEGFACAHGDFSNPENFNYVLEAQDAVPSWEARGEQVLFVGHSHKPAIFVLGASGTPHWLDAADFTLEDGKRYIVNPGSVGYPRSGDCRSSYCIYDDEARTVEFRSLPFDLESYAAKMHGQGLNEAPWMLARAAERRRPFVRGAAQFGAAVEQKLAPPAGGSGVSPLPKPPPDEAARTRFPPRAVMLISLGVLATAGIVAYTLFVLRSMSKDRAAVGETSVQEISPAPALVQPVKSAQEETLTDGWKYTVDAPGEQKAKMEYNQKKQAWVFRIEHAALHTVRFAKRLSLRPSWPEKLYWNVRIADKPRVGERVDFRFTTHLVFRDEDGAVVGQEDRSRKLSMDEHCSVPATAVEAELAIDCTCEGTHDLVVPYFADRPFQKKQKEKSR